MRFSRVLWLPAAVLVSTLCGDAQLTPESAETALRKALDAAAARQGNGGWGHAYTRDGAIMWGEHTPKPKGWITVQPPGTPTVGSVFVHAARVLNAPEYAEVARDARDALRAIQSAAGGFPHEGNPEAGPSPRGTFDDDTTTGALRFLLAWWEYTRAEEDWKTVMRVGDFILKAQYPDSGGWPQSYPPPGGYGKYITFNDNNIEKIMDVLLDLYARTGEQRFLDAAKKGGECILRLQGGPGEAIWAQQYDKETLEPAWARKFEPPGYTPAESVGVCNTLIALFLATGEKRFLEPLPRAFEWYETHRLENGKYARLYEPATQRPVYGRRDKAEKVYDFKNACSGYAWQGNWYPHGAKQAYDRIEELGRDAYLAGREKEKPESEDLERPAVSVIAGLEDNGEWLRGPTERERAEYEKRGIPEDMPIVSMGVFVRNARTLLLYLEAVKESP